MGLWERVTRCHLLYLEDMGRSRPSDWWLGTLWELLDVRQSREGEGLRGIFTANTPKEPKAAYSTLVERYDDTIVDRMIDGGGLVMFDGPAIRDFKTEW
jgi:DNA replication protein DnaC